MSSVVQRSLAGGELSPEHWARVDQAKYGNALRLMRNSWTKKSSGSQNRPGTSFTSEVLNSANKSRMIPFIFSNDQAYNIEFGSGYFRVYQNGQVLCNAAVPQTNIQGISNNAICTVQVTDVTYIPSIGGGFPFPEVIVKNAQGLTELNGRTFLVTNPVGATNTFEITDILENPIDTSTFEAWTEGGTIGIVIGGILPYASADLPNIQYSQSGDIITLTCPGYPVYELQRTEDTLGNSVFTAVIATLGGEVALYKVPYALAPGGSGSFTYRYCATALLENGEETTPLVQSTGSSTNWTITGVIKGSQCKITVASTTGIQVGDLIFVAGIQGMGELNGKYFTAQVVSGTQISINVNSTGFDAYISGGQVYLCSVMSAVSAAPSSSAPNVISNLVMNTAYQWSGGQIMAFNIYTESGGIFSYLGTTPGSTFSDTGQQWDVTINPPVANVFRDHNSTLYGNPNSPNLLSIPQAVSYCKQRLFFGNFSDDPTRIVASQIGRYSCYNQGTPITDLDVVDFSIAGNRVAAVRFVFELLDTIIFTQSGEYSAVGDGTEVTPSDIGLKKHSGNGCSLLPPLILNSTALYVQARGNIVRDFAWNWQVNGYDGSDLTRYAYHLLEGHTIVSWAYQQTPNSIVWMVRDDGIVLGLTYVKEDQILAWHHHDFPGGFVEDVSCVPEGLEDVVYFIIRRTINGVTKRYIERLNTRLVDPLDKDDITDAVFMDAALTFDGRNTDDSITMTLSGSGWTYQDTLTLTCSASFFQSTYVGDEIHLNLINTDITSDTYGDVIDQIRFTINAMSSATVVTGRPNKTVPLAMQGAALSNWSRAVSEVSGLLHIAGEDVSILGDGFVVANPNNPKYGGVTVTANGFVTLAKCYSVLHIGLPYTSDLETLDIDTAQGETIADRQKLTSAVTLFLNKTRGLFVGPKAPGSDVVDQNSNLTEFKPRTFEASDDPAKLMTGKFNLNIEPQWNSGGRVFIRQTDPLPAEVNAIVESGLYPFQGAS